MMSNERMYEIINYGLDYFLADLNDDVSDYLYEKEAISRSEYDAIYLHVERENRIYALLELILNKKKETQKLWSEYLEKWYPWIFRKIILISNKSVDDSEVEDILKVGGAPNIPHRHVSRKDMCTQLRIKLHKLKRGKYIVIYGMRGCGKTTLLAEALRNHSLVVNAFEKHVYWLTVSRSADEAVLLRDLLSQISCRQQPLSEDTTAVKIQLKQMLNENFLKECLLVLDDVSSSTVIENFNLGCKIAITTHDKTVMESVNDEINYIHVVDHFREDETLHLFQISVGSEKLPQQATRIHHICKGFPMTISLLSSQLEQHKEDAVRNTGRWDFYIEKLKDKNIDEAIGRYDPIKSKAIEHLFSAIGMCIDSLDEKEKYKDFALFQDDVNIKPEVLCILWDLSKKEVEDIMLQFDNKSLAVRMWNECLNSYVYSIHDLLLDYLKNQLSPDQKKKLHLKLINRYKNKYQSIYSFPDNDNYILLYWGHHLQEAGLNEEFPNLYLDLKFVEKKIKASGPGDLLSDYKKYRDFICNNKNNEKKCEDFVQFVNWAGIRIYKSSCDIIQFGLQEIKSSCVYKQAVQLSKSSSTKYFHFLTEPPDPPSYYHCREEIVTTIFTLTNQNVLVSNAAGDIKLVDIVSNQTITTYKGHSEIVTRLSLCPKRNFFLSASNDSTVRVWRLDTLADVGSSRAEPRTPSPQFRQLDWLDPWKQSRSSGEQPIMTLAKHNEPITDANFAHRAPLIVTASEDKTVRLWTYNDEEITSHCDVFKTNSMPVSCCFNDDDALIICALERGLIQMYTVSSRSLCLQREFTDPIRSFLLVPRNQCTALVLHTDYMGIYKLLSLDRGNKSPDFQDCLSLKPLNCKKNIICASISFDGQYVAAAYANYKIFICEIATGKSIFEFHESNGLPRSLDWSRNNLDLMAAYDNKTLKFYNLDESSSLRNSIHLKSTVFDAVWTVEDDDEYVTAATLTTASNTIKVFDERGCRQTLKLQDEGQISHVAVSPLDGNNVIYCCKDGSVYLASIASDVDSPARLLMRVKYIMKMKLFVRRNSLLMVTVLSFSTVTSGKLTSWIQEESEKYDGSIIEFGDDKESKMVHDFFLHRTLDRLFSIEINHTIRVYDCSNGMVIDKKIQNISNVLVCDFCATDDWKLCTGTDQRIIFYKNNLLKLESIPLLSEAKKPKICRFSTSGKYLSFGYENGLVTVLAVENDFTIYGSATFEPGSVKDIIWNKWDTHMLVILTRDVILTSINSFNVESHLYLTVEKIIPSHNFDKFVTVDSNGGLIVFCRDNN